MTFGLMTLALAAETVSPEITGIDFSGLFIKMVALLAVIIVFGFVLVRYLSPTSRFRAKGQNRNFEVIDVYRLEPKKAIYIVRIGRRRFALGAGESQINLITELDESDLQT